MNIDKSKNVIIAGCGRFGSSLAGALCEHGYQISVIDMDSNAFRRLSETFSGYEIVGDATNCDTLENAGIMNAEMLIASTDSDNMNSLIAQIASRIYNVGRVFIRLKDIEKAQLVDGYNIDIISPFRLCLSEFEALSSINLGGGAEK